MLRLASWPRLTACALAAASLLVGRDASAYCRTTTVLQPADYDSSASGCWSDGQNHGVPLFWRNACVGYSIQRGVSRKVGYDDAANLISQAFTRWTGATCQTDGRNSSRPSIDVRDLGPADCTRIQYVSGKANQNVIVFRDDSWVDSKGAPRPSTVLGLTTVVYAPSTGEIYGADMEINTLDMDPLAVRDPVTGRAYDFLSVVTHEAGHFLGMAHSDHREATMYASYEPGQTYQRVLSPDDVNGICAVYRPNGDRAVLNDKVAAAPQCDPTPRGGYTTECLERGCSTAPGSASSVPAALLGVALVARRLRRRASASSR